MTFVLLTFLGGVLTILSPCILPVLPFIFARSEQPFLKSGLPLLAGMASSFVAVATLAAVGGAWAVHVNQYGRILALVVLAVLALTLLSTHLADWLARPFVALGNRLSQPVANTGSQSGVLRSLLLGVATGLLWAPCAGPILGLVLTGAAISGPNVHTSVLLLAYALGAASSLAVAMLAGQRLFAALKRSLGAGVWIRRALGIAVLAAVAVIALGWDTSVLTQWSIARTDRWEQALVNRINPAPVAASSGVPVMTGNTGQQGLPMEGPFPSLAGASSWLNSPPLTSEALRGKVVVIDFWTYSCINCLRSLPYVKAWYEKYKDHGLVIIGVHTPEFAFEKDLSNVRRALADLGVQYPVALDNQYAIWQAFHNRYWPAHYFIDATGQIRGHHFGEGDYDAFEQIIRRLLLEAGATDLPSAGLSAMNASGVQASADSAHIQSPETYIGYGRAEHFSSPSGFVKDQPQDYTAPPTLALNQWALKGTWVVSSDQATLVRTGGSVAFQFEARDLHLVLGPATSGHPVRFRVLLDSAAPGSNHGEDTDADGNGTVREQRLYQLIRQSKDVGAHTFVIQFLDQGVQAFAFTFG
jgi:cytochrome c biogenesis protein CcdA/thiol-disulfide isomerase/thioredoxin